MPSGDGTAAGTVEDPPVPSQVLTDAKPGKIVLDIRMASFEIRRGNPGEIRVEGEFDSGRFKLEDTYEEKSDGWVYTVDYRRRGMLRPFIQFSDDDAGRVRLYIPPDMPVELTGKVGLGESWMELGGLFLTEVDLETGVGEHTISFEDPTFEPLDRFLLNGSIGELEVENLGNASPGRVRVESSIGELRVDLSGAWRGDGNVVVAGGIGELSVRLPDDGVNVQVDKASVGIGDSSGSSWRNRRKQEIDPTAPTVTVRVSGAIGEVRVD